MTFTLWFYDTASLVGNVRKYNDTTLRFHNYLYWRLQFILDKEGLTYFEL